MGHLPEFIEDLAIILIMAGFVTIIFKWLKQPIVLGYIVAGFLASPHFGFTPTVVDAANISIWAEIGIIFLLFALGLEFSFKKLISVGGTASIATFINVGCMITTGYLVGQLLGWPNMDSIFLGCMISMSSTTVIIKAFNEMGLQKQKFSNIVFGMLIVEDLVAIIMMVVLSTIAVSQHFEGDDLLFSIFKLVFFLVIWFVVGIFLIPTLLKRFKRYLNDETLLIVAIGMCLGMVMFATSVGFSAPLGAFIMGSILAETVESKHIEHLIQPIKNLFGAVFFVSVGMMISPPILVEYAIPIIILTGTVLIGRVCFGTLGVLASGEGLKTAMNAGFCLGQIGEFSFIIATLGMQLKVIDGFLYPVIVAVSVITTFITPYFIRMSDGVYGVVEKRVPTSWNKLIDGYAASGYKSINKQSDWHKLLKAILSGVSIYIILTLSVIFFSKLYVIPFILNEMPHKWGAALAALVTLLLSSPFLKAIIHFKTKSAEFKNLWSDNSFNKGALVSLSIVRAIIAIALVLLILVPLFPKMTPLLTLIAIFIVSILIFTQAFKSQTLRMQERFFKNLHEKENVEKQNKYKNIDKALQQKLLTKDLHIEEFEIVQNSIAMGRTLEDMSFKQETGVTIVTIIRGQKRINMPTGKDQLFPQDIVVVVGTDKQIDSFGKMIECPHNVVPSDVVDHHIALSQFIVEEYSNLIGKSIRELKVREKTECVIIGINRGGTSITDIAADLTFQEHDVIWLAAESNNLKKFQERLL